MKFMILFSFIFCVQVGAKSRAQTVTLSLEKVKVQKVFREISRQTGLSIVYKESILNGLPHVSIHVDEVSPEEALATCLKNMPFSFEIEEKTVTIKVREIQRPLSTSNLMQLTLPEIDVHGKVTDADGMPLEGVSVMIKNVNRGTATNSKGEYSLSNVDEKATLKFSFVGYESLEVRIKKRSVINVRLQIAVQSLDETVVIGYGTARRSDLTGSIASVPSRVFDNPTFGDIGYAIQGQISGVNILTGDGSPGEPVQISVRGVGSLLGNTAPLIVLDNMPMPSDFDLNDLNPQDIKSMDVLKGASSAAIYGSRAASGVIIINTKKGGFGEKPQVGYTYNFGFDRMASDIDVLTGEEWKYMMFEGVRNAAIYNGYSNVEAYSAYTNFVTPGYFGNYDTHWLDEMLQPSGIQSHNLSLRGGTKNSHYTASLGYSNDLGIMKESSFKRYNLNLGLNTRVSRKLTFDINIRGNSSDRDRATATLHDAIAGRPDIRAYNDDGTVFLNTYLQNGNGQRLLIESPLSKLLDNINNNVSENISLSSYLEYQVLKNLSIRTRLNHNIRNSKSKSFSANTTTAGSGFGFVKAGSLRDSRLNSTQTEWENTLNYKLRFKKHNLDFVLATSYLTENRKSASISFDDFPDNKIQNEFYQGATYRSSSGYNNQAYMISYIGRVNYRFNRNYLLTASFRRDGSSKFSADNAYGNFPALAGAWIISNESFMKSAKWINFLKLRAGIGKTGMADVGYYRWRTTYEAANYNGASAVIPYQAGNENLKWETTIQNDIGIDFRLMDSRVRGSIGYYNKNTEGLLYPFTMAPSTGYRNATVNFAKIKNSGFDIDLQVDVIKKNNIYWSVGANFNNNKNIVQKLDKSYITSTDGSQTLRNSIIKEGYPLGLIYGFKTNGIYTTTEQLDGDKGLDPDKNYQRDMILGEIRYVDLNGDGYVDLSTASAINNPDRTIIGYSLPKFSGGFNTTFNYKDWTLNIFGSYTYGNDKVWVNELGSFGTSMTPQPKNVWRVALKRWTPENPDSRYPSFRIARTFPSREFNDFSVYDASFIKIQKVQVQYNLPNNIIKKLKVVSTLKLFVGVNNVYTFTKYPGPTPESYSRDDRIQGASMDYSEYPKNRTYTFGIKLNLK